MTEQERKAKNKKLIILAVVLSSVAFIVQAAILIGSAALTLSMLNPSSGGNPFAALTTPFAYTQIEDGIRIGGLKDGKRAEGKLEIPAEIGGEPVVEIAEGAFMFDGITELIIPEGVKRIEGSAFSYNSDLTTVSIPNSIESISVSAFASCDSLVYNDYIYAHYLGNSENPYVVLVSAFDENVLYANINENTKIIASNAFYNCKKIEGAIAIPDGVKSIGKNAFYSCDKVMSVSMTDSVVEIGAYAFAFCNNLLTVELSNSITEIKSNTFYHCSNLRNITIPSGVTKIGEEAFYRCNSIKTLTIPKATNSIGKGAFVVGASTEIIFEDPEGWTAGYYEIKSSDLESTKKVRELFLYTYEDLDWTKK